MARISKLEEENEKNKAKYASLCDNCLKDIKAHVIESPVIQLQAIGENHQ